MQQRRAGPEPGARLQGRDPGLRKVWGLSQGPRRRKVTGPEAAGMLWMTGAEKWPLATDNMEVAGEGHRQAKKWGGANDPVRCLPSPLTGGGA